MLLANVIATNVSHMPRVVANEGPSPLFRPHPHPSGSTPVGRGDHIAADGRAWLVRCLAALMRVAHGQPDGLGGRPVMLVLHLDEDLHPPGRRQVTVPTAGD